MTGFDMKHSSGGMGHVENFRLLSGYVDQLPAGTILGVRALCAIVWPPALDESQCLEIDPENERPERFIAAVESKGRIVATAEGFPRIVRTEHGELRVLALASVCTLPECRGMGLGQRAVQTILKQVDRGDSLSRSGKPACRSFTGRWAPSRCATGSSTAATRCTRTAIRFGTHTG